MWTHKVKFRFLSKDEGYEIKISAFQSQEFGFGYPLTVPYLQIIGEYHALQHKYVNIEAATTILIHTHK